MSVCTLPKQQWFFGVNTSRLKAFPRKQALLLWSIDGFYLQLVGLGVDDGGPVWRRFVWPVAHFSALVSMKDHLKKALRKLRLYYLD